MGHDHAHGGGDRRRLGIALGIVLVVLAAEVVGAAVSGSLALLADAGHMATDALGLVIAIVAATVARRPASDRHTFGFQRMEVFGALANGVILVLVAIFVATEAVRRLLDAGQLEVRGGVLLAVAALGLVANLVALAVLRGGDRTSLNLRGATLEVFGDLVGSLAAVIAGVCVLVFGWAVADPIASLAIAAFILPRAALLLRDVFRVLGESAPAGTDVAEIREHLLETTGVIDVHDVHVWTITSGSPVFSAHVVVDRDVFTDGRSGPLLDRLGGCLSDHFDVEHSTFQIEPAGHVEHEARLHR